MKPVEAVDDTGEINPEMMRKLKDIPPGPKPGLDLPDARTFPILYKKSNTGALMIWRIFVADTVIHTTYGQIGGVLQSTQDSLKCGKNAGKKNATTAAEQAVLEAAARWKKKQAREGYVADMERAKAGESDAQGGIAPMLAQARKDAEKHVRFPSHAQRKLNGIRCIAVVDGGQVSLWSRKRTRIQGVPHIEEAIAQSFMGVSGRYVFDGEIYRHGWSLQKIGGYVRKQVEPKAGFEELRYCIYDLPQHGGTWLERYEALRQLQTLKMGFPQVEFVETYDILTEADIKSNHDLWVAEGYEGLMLRNLDGLYEAGKRSYQLIKVKEFEEQEFPITGVTEGRGRMEGKAIFVCQAPNGKLFEVVAPGTMEDKAEFLQRQNEVVGKQVTVAFLEWTDGGVPSHGTAKAVRDYE